MSAPQKPAGKASRLPWPRRPATAAESAPEVITISFDRLRWILTDFLQQSEKAGRWVSYTGVALTLWGSLIVSNWPKGVIKFGLAGEQWQVVFVVAAGWATLRAGYGLIAYLRRPRFGRLIEEIVRNAVSTREIRAIALLKVRGPDHGHRILVYRDPLWDCYMLPHYNMADTRLQEMDDPDLCNWVAALLGIQVDQVSCNNITGGDLRSRKHSQFHRQDTLYHFSFYQVRFADPGTLPQHLRDRRFEYHGTRFHWLTISELEADPNTRHLNLDMTRHLADHASALLTGPPDSLPMGFVHLPNP